MGTKIKRETDEASLFIYSIEKIFYCFVNFLVATTAP